MNNHQEKTLYNVRSNIYICLFLFFSILIIYWQVKNYGFISLDDPAYVVDNTNVTSGFSSQNIRWAFRFHQIGDHTYYHPLTWLSHMLDCQLFGLSSGAHHLSNVFYHIFNSCLLFFMLWLLTGKRWQSAFVTALFALHPLNVESVAWISERKNLLSTSFWFLTILSYMLYVKQKSILRYLLVIICMLLGLLTKPMLVTIPCVLLLLDLWPLKRIQHKEFASGEKRIFQNLYIFFHTNIFLIIEKIPFFLLSIIWSFLSTISNQRIGSIISTEIVPMDLRIANALVSYVRYLWKMIWPMDLAFFYPYPSEMLPTWQIVGSTVLIILVSLLFVQRWKERPWLIVGWLWYLGILVPVSGIMINGLWPAIADRWSYLPLIGIFIIVSWEAVNFFDKYRFQKVWISIIAFALLISLMITTWQQVKTWENSATVYQQALSVTENNSVAHNHYGRELQEKNDERCVHHFVKAIQISPDWAQPHYGLAKFMESRNNIKQSLFHYQQAIRLNPEFALAYADLGRLLIKQDKTKGALYSFLQAVKFKPDFYQVYNELGKLYQSRGELTKSIEHFQKAIQINPDDEIIYYNLAIALTDQGKISEAIQYYIEAIRLKPDFAEAHNSIGTAYQKNNNLKKSIAHYKEAIRIKPDFADAENNLANVMILIGDISEAMQHLSNIILNDPTFAAAYNTMGLAMAAQHKHIEAIKYYTESIRLSPSFSEAYNNLGILYYQQDELETALKHFQSAVQKIPDNVELQKNLNYITTTLDKINLGIKQIKQQIDNDPKNSILYYQLGKLYQKRENYDDAIMQYNKALSLNEKFTVVFIELAKIHKKQNRLTEAITFFEKSISLNPDNAFLYLEVIRLYSQQNMIEDAVKYLKKAKDSRINIWKWIEVDNELEKIRQMIEYKNLIEDYRDETGKKVNPVILDKNPM